MTGKRKLEDEDEEVGLRRLGFEEDAAEGQEGGCAELGGLYEGSDNDNNRIASLAWRIPVLSSKTSRWSPSLRPPHRRCRPCGHLDFPHTLRLLDIQLRVTDMGSRIEGDDVLYANDSIWL